MMEIFFNMGLWLATSIALATVNSRIIFGLREEVKAARQIGQYLLERKIGEGGMGVVYLATHALLRRKTALKMLLADRVDPQTLARSEREVRQLARLAHPNTVAIYDYGRTPEGTFYFAMEYLQGLGLDDLVRAVGPLPPARVVHLLDQICGSDPPPRLVPLGATPGDHIGTARKDFAGKRRALLVGRSPDRLSGKSTWARSGTPTGDGL